MKIYLVRHTSVDVPKGTCYGQTDVPLRDSFEDEATIVAEKLSDYKFDQVFASPLSRCTHLCDYCGYSTKILDKRLIELDFGDWENQLWDKLDMSIWKTDWVNPPTPNGESFQQMYDRVASFFDELQTENYQTVVIFTHAGVINCAKVYFEHIDIQKTFDLVPKYGEIVVFEI